MHPFWPDRSPHFLTCRLAVRPFISQRRQSAESQSPIVVGLSGGPDSLALVAACRAEGAPVHAVIVDHQLQPGSERVAHQARCQAEALGATADVVKVTVPSGGSLEANARSARYRALLQATPPAQPESTPPAQPAPADSPAPGPAPARTASVGVPASPPAQPEPTPPAQPAPGVGEVFIAHTLDDQAETYLLGGLRGNPGGMAQREGRIVRPFLTIRRADTEGACAELGLTPWHDPQNSDPGFLRVLVRTKVLPDLAATLGYDPAPALAQAAMRCAENRQAVVQIAEATLDDAVRVTPSNTATGHTVHDTPSNTARGVAKSKTLSLDAATMAKHPRAVRTRALERFLRAAGAPVNRQILSQVENLAVDWHGQGPVSLGSFLEVQRVNGKLIVSDRTVPEE